MLVLEPSDEPVPLPSDLQDKCFNKLLQDSIAKEQELYPFCYLTLFIEEMKLRLGCSFRGYSTVVS